MAELEGFEPTPEPAAQNPSSGAERSGGDEQIASNYCPRCSARLAARSCKLICAACGYYMSCSDFY